MSKGAGFGMLLTLATRKKASWRASTARIEAGPGTSVGSVKARPEATLMTAPIPAEVMMLARARNSAALETGNSYLQGVKVGFLK